MLNQINPFIQFNWSTLCNHLWGSRFVPMTFTAFRPVLVRNKHINLRHNKSFWAPELTQRLFFLGPAMFPRLRVWGRLQQHLRLRQDPRRRPEPAVLRVCGQRGICLFGKGGGELFCLKTDAHLCCFPPPPPVVCRNVRPKIRPPPAGEHREESGSVHPAGDEPEAHKAPVLPGQKLPWQPVKRFVRAAWSVLLTL